MRNSNCWIKPTKSQDFSWRFILRRDYPIIKQAWNSKSSICSNIQQVSLYVYLSTFPKLFSQGLLFHVLLIPLKFSHLSQKSMVLSIKLFEAKCLIHVDDLWFFWPSWQTTKPPFFLREKTATLIIHPFSCFLYRRAKNTTSDASSNCDWSSSFWVFNLAMSLSFLRAAKSRLFVALRMLIDNNSILLSWYYIHVT